MLVNGATALSERELSSYFSKMSPELNGKQLKQLSSLAKDGVAVMIDTRSPVILALDKVI